MRGRARLDPRAGLARVALVLTLALPGSLRPAYADGGLVRAHSVQGPLTLTLFTTPTPLRAGDADVSVLVQDSASLSTLLDAAVELRVERLDGDGATSSVRLTHDAATNRLLQAATIALPAAGRYRLTADVRHGALAASAAAEVSVAPPLPALLALWPYLALPPLVIVIFLVHQRLRRRPGGTARGSLVVAAAGASAR